MSVLVVGLNHRSAEFALLERVAVPAEELRKALRTLTALDHVLEAVVLSTCNRVEIYAHVSRFHPALGEILAWLAGRGDVDPNVLEAVHYTYHDDRAAAHLFRVASGVDSMVVGEQQIALQVKQALKVARAEGAARRVLQKMFDQALHVSRRVRSETDISSGASSMVEVGLEATVRELGGSVAGRTVLIVGAGTMGSLAASRLRDAGADRVLVRNHSQERAGRLADRVGAEIVPAGGLRGAIAASDLVVCCTGASNPTIDAELVADAQQARGDRPLVLLDLAMPRNVEPAVGSQPGVTLIDIEDIREVTDRTVAGPSIDEATSIVEEEAHRFLAWEQAVRVEPTIRALRERAEDVRAAEVERFGGRLAGLDERQRDALEALTRGIVNTLLHEPTVRLKGLGERNGAEHYANAVRELFDLDE